MKDNLESVWEEVKGHGKGQGQEEGQQGQHGRRGTQKTVQTVSSCNRKRTPTMFAGLAGAARVVCTKLGALEEVSHS